MKLQTLTKLALYTSLIRPVVLYGHESWTLKDADYQILKVFELKILCSILGSVVENGKWSRRMNEPRVKPSIQKCRHRQVDKIRQITVGWTCSAYAGRETSKRTCREPGTGRWLWGVQSRKMRKQPLMRFVNTVRDSFEMSVGICSKFS